MLVGYLRVSKAEGSQTLDLHRDALLATGASAEQLYDDRVSGRTDDRPGVASCLNPFRSSIPSDTPPRRRRSAAGSAVLTIPQS